MVSKRVFRVKLFGGPAPIVLDSKEFILVALMRRNVKFPYACQNGVCGTCKCQLIAGEVVLNSYSESALTAYEYEQGLILACRARVLSDVIIGKLEPDSDPAHRAGD
ncbi:MAG: 2Fe-2S iron-sulfur cluster-binding protein [Burkholderiales bacterium]|jgi:ferredoxin